MKFRKKNHSIEDDDRYFFLIISPSGKIIGEIRSFLPCAIRIREIHITIQRFFYLSPTGKFAASVAGDRLYRSFGKLGKRGYDRLRHCLSLSVRDFNCNIISRLPLRKRGKTCLAFPLSRYHSVRFPMSELFAVIYAFIPFADALPRREPSAVAHAFTGFPFSPQVFQGGTQVSFVYPTVDRLE